MSRPVWLGGSLLLAAATAACVSVLPEAGPPPLVYRLAAAYDEAAFEDRDAPTVSGAPGAPLRVVKVGRPTAPASLSSDRIALARADGDVAVVAGARWDGALPALFQQVLADAVDRAAPDVTAAMSGDGVAAEHDLATAIRAFEAVSDRGDVRDVRVAVAARLVDLRDRRLIGARTFVKTTPVERADGAAAIAKALSQTAESVAAEIAAWTRDALPADGAAEG